MRFAPTLFSRLAEPLDRRRCEAKRRALRRRCFTTSRFARSDHLMVLIHAQSTGASSLRALTIGCNAKRQRPRSPPLRRSPPARPSPTPTPAGPSKPSPKPSPKSWRGSPPLTDRSTRAEAKNLPRLIDSTPIPLGKLFDWAKIGPSLGQDWAKSNGRIRGVKADVVFALGRDPPGDPRPSPTPTSTTLKIGRRIEVEPGLADVFDKGYRRSSWRGSIPAAEAVFVARPKRDMGLTVRKERRSGPSRGDGFTRDLRGGRRVLEPGRFQAPDPAAPHRDRARRGRKDLSS